MGLVLKDVVLPVNNRGHVILAQPSPVLAYPISSTEARMLIDFPGGVPDVKSGACAQYLMDHVRPQLPSELHPSFDRAVSEAGDKLSAYPNRTLNARPYKMGGVLVIGDALNMRHPLTGGGMTVGFTDLETAARCLAPVRFAKDTQSNLSSELDAAVQRFYAERQAANRVINILADALYGVFASKNEDLREACFTYLNKGGFFADGPTRFLSGVSRSQPFLLMHFFSVALYGCGGTLLPFPTPARLAKAWSIFHAALRIILPLIAAENPKPIIAVPINALRALVDA